MLIFETLAPLILLIALGAGLAHIRFLGKEFMADLNKLAFWIALPALLFTSALHASKPGENLWLLLAILGGTTLAMIFLSWVTAILLGIPPSARGTLMQASFRGNLAYIGVPVLSYGTHADKETLASGVIIMVGLMSSYNILAVLVLQSGKHQQPDWKKMARSILGNPLLLSGTLGLVFSTLSLPLPGFLIKTLDSLGSAAVPIALLCIGGSLAITSLQGRLSWIIAAALLKVAVLPGIVWALVSIAGLGPAEQRIALVLASAPTAAASYIMAKEMGGDEALASGSIALSTILSGFSLVFSLWITS